nr:MATE family efflux transporter [Clostridia bacterium]
MHNSENKALLRRFVSLFRVIAAQNIIVFAVNLADNIMLGRFSQDAMSGVSLANQVQFFLQQLVVGAAGGLAVISSQYWGKRETEPIKKLFSACLYTAAALASAVGLTVIIFPSGIMGLLTNDPGAAAEGAAYLRIVGFSYLAFSVTNVILGLLRSVETVRIGFVIALSALVSNIPLNYVFIFGKLGLPAMGSSGAAVATLISRLVELAIASLYLLKIDKKLRVRFRDWFVTDKTLFRDFIKAGFPMLFSGASWGLAMFAQSAITGRLGLDAIAASSIAGAVYSVLSVIYASSANASSVIIAKTVGEGDVNKVKNAAKLFQLVFLALGLFSCTLSLATKNAVLSMYDLTAGAAGLANTFLTIQSFTVIGSSYQMPCLCG